MLISIDNSNRYMNSDISLKELSQLTKQLQDKSSA